MWFHYARTMIFWSRSYLCIYFPWNPLDFGDANSLKALVNKGTLYPLKLWSPCIFGPLESLRPKLDLWSPWIIEAEIVLCWGTQRHGVAAWGVVRLLGVVMLLGDLETSQTALKPSNYWCSWPHNQPWILLTFDTWRPRAFETFEDFDILYPWSHEPRRESPDALEPLRLVETFDLLDL